MLLMSVFGTTMTAFALVGSTSKAFQRGVGTYGLMASSSGLIHALCFFLIGIKLWSIGKKHGYVTQIQFFPQPFRVKRHRLPAVSDSRYSGDPLPADRADWRSQDHDRNDRGEGNPRRNHPRHVPGIVRKRRDPALDHRPGDLRRGTDLRLRRGIPLRRLGQHLPDDRVHGHGRAGLCPHFKQTGWTRCRHGAGQRHAQDSCDGHLQLHLRRSRKASGRSASISSPSSPTCSSRSASECFPTCSSTG